MIVIYTCGHRRTRQPYKSNMLVKAKAVCIDCQPKYSTRVAVSRFTMRFRAAKLGGRRS